MLADDKLAASIKVILLSPTVTIKSLPLTEDEYSLAIESVEVESNPTIESLPPVE